MIIEKGYINDVDTSLQGIIFKEKLDKTELGNLSKDFNLDYIVKAENFKEVYYATFNDGDMLISPNENLDVVFEEAKKMMSSSNEEDFQEIKFGFDCNYIGEVYKSKVLNIRNMLENLKGEINDALSDLEEDKDYLSNSLSEISNQLINISQMVEFMSYKKEP